MNIFIRKISEYILSLHRYSKRIIAITLDICLCVVLTWFSFVLRLEELILFKDLNYFLILVSTIIAIPIFWLFGLYRTIFRYPDLSIILTILFSSFVYGLLFFFIVGVYGIQNVPRSIGIIQPMLLFFGIIFSRLGLKYVLLAPKYTKNPRNKKNVLVYGAGEAGRQLVIALQNNPEFKTEGFLDDDAKIHRQVLLGKTIYSPLKLGKLIQNKNISLIFLAIPSINRNRRNQIIDYLNKFKLTVKTLPSISEIVDDRISISDIKDFNIDDLLNRDEIKQDARILGQNIYHKTVLVTGGGGTIGSELCRQIAKLKPIKLIILEMNEFHLYKIYEEIKNLNKNLKIISLLGNTQDQLKLERIFQTFQVDTVYHAAAYKHVPLVEENICEGVKNNIFSTLAVAKASVEKNVSNLVLVSSDKAVRPTNIMGATKRFSELCMQAICKDNKEQTTQFSIVRFGNVLESSGSVIPKFKKQIKDGGPVTLTHEDVTRYFMTIKEAAQLVIEAGTMGKNSEVFVLDMGQSVKIKDMIYKMVKLSGFSVKDKNTPDGDIEIEIIGLRPGEKLYEELLIGDNPKKTMNSKIFKITEDYIPMNQLKKYLVNLRQLLDSNDAKAVKNLLFNVLNLNKSSSKIVDHIYVEQSLSKKFHNELDLVKKDDNKVVKIK